MTPTRNAKFLPAALLLLALSFSAHALESDRKQPISIDADSGSLDQKNQVTVFSGNVIIKQGSINMRPATNRATKPCRPKAARSNSASSWKTKAMSKARATAPNIRPPAI